jgi:hypothetical protein
MKNRNLEMQQKKQDALLEKQGLVGDERAET